jgi:cleavage stimulation factor subunit 3
MRNRQMNASPVARDTVRKAYDFALNHIGHDKESGSIWGDYIQLLKQLEVCINSHRCDEPH